MRSHYKTPLSRLGDPVARVLLQAHVRPNHLTVLGLGVSIVAAGALAGGRLRVGAVLLTPAGLFDFFDGSPARLAKSVSAFGAFLDSVVDRCSGLVRLLRSGLCYPQGDCVRGIFSHCVPVIGTA